MTVRILPLKMSDFKIIGPDHPNKKDIEFLIDQRRIWREAKNYLKADEIKQTLLSQYKVVLRDVRSSCEWKLDDYVQPKAPMTEEWKLLAKIYKEFIPNGINVDLSESALEEAYVYDTRGVGEGYGGIFSSNGVYNGYIIGKKYFDVTLTMWQEDIKCGLITKWEIINHYKDSEIREWIAKRLGASL